MSSSISYETAQTLAEQAGLSLVHENDGLVLSDGNIELRANFDDMCFRIVPDKLSRELLVRAAKIKHGPDYPTLIDATAGLGEDSFLLAAAGFDVTMFESNPVIAALLEDACAKAMHDDALVEPVLRMHLRNCDSVLALQNMNDSPDVIYLDPMFPERRKSAAVKKKFQLLHHLESPTTNDEELLLASIALHPKKIVIKRPLKGPTLGNIKPSYSLRGKSVRYDVLVGV